MVRFLQFVSLAPVILFAALLIPTDASALTVDCTTAQTMLGQCNKGRSFQCQDCCGMAGYAEGSYQYDDCYSICTAKSTDGCVDSGSGGGSGGGNSCIHGSCSSSSECSSYYPVCNNGCCQERTGQTVTIRTPICNSSNSCTCEFIGGGAGDNFTTWLIKNCGVTTGSGNGLDSSFGFPQTDCETLATSTLGAVLEYGSTSLSYYNACSGYIRQTPSTITDTRSCTTCKTGYTRKSYAEVLAMTYGNDYISSDYSSWPCKYSVDTFSSASDVYVCVKMCTATYGNWASYATGYERRSVTRPTGCSNASSYQYRCAAGYYGSSTNGTSGCTKCPSVCNSVATTSTAGNTSLGGCCAAAGSRGTNAKGSFLLKNAVCAE